MARRSGPIRSADAVQIVGGRELRRALKNTEDGLDELARVHREAAQMVVRHVIGPPRRTGRWIGSLQARGTRTMGYVQGGGPRAPHFGVQEFGGSVPRRGRKGTKLIRHRGKHLRGIAAEYTLATRQASSRRTVIKPYKRSGYYLFPALKRTRPLIYERFQTTVEGVLSKSFS